MDCLHFGKGGDDKLVVLPGLSLRSVMGSAEAIVSAYAPLAEGFDTYLLDHVREEPEGYSVGDMADDALGAFDALGIECAHVMGVVERPAGTPPPRCCPTGRAAGSPKAEHRLR